MNEERERPETELVVVATVYTRPEHALLLSVLEQEGIWTVARGEGHVSVDPGLTVALRGIDLQVSRYDAARASELLLSLEPWQPSKGIYTDVRPLDILLTLLLCWFGVPPPARIPASAYVVAPARAAAE